MSELYITVVEININARLISAQLILLFLLKLLFGVRYFFFLPVVYCLFVFIFFLIYIAQQLIGLFF